MSEKKELKALQMQIARAIGKRIKSERTARGWTAYRLAKESEMTAPHIERIESGKIAPRVDIITRLCFALNIEISLPIV